MGVSADPLWLHLTGLSFSVCEMASRERSQSNFVEGSGLHGAWAWGERADGHGDAGKVVERTDG